MLDLVLLRNGVGDHHSLEVGVVDARDGRTGEDAMGQNGIDFSSSSRDQPRAVQRAHGVVLRDWQEQDVKVLMTNRTIFLFPHIEKILVIKTDNNNLLRLRYKYENQTFNWPGKQLRTAD